jgi:putative membrane protein
VPGPDAVAAATDPRVYFAAERTLLAWIRTGLSLMGFGFVVARFGLFLRQIALAAAGSAPGAAKPPPPTGVSLVIGVALVVLGVAASALAAVQYARTLTRLRRGEPYTPPPFSLAIAAASALAVVGLIMAAYLLAVGR